MKPNPDTFLSAAEYLFSVSHIPYNGEDIISFLKESNDVSPYSCDAIHVKGCGEDSDFYSSLYEKDALKDSLFHFFWWPLVNGNWDFESRIFALLLAREVLGYKKPRSSYPDFSINKLPKTYEAAFKKESPKKIPKGWVQVKDGEVKYGDILDYNGDLEWAHKLVGWRIRDYVASTDVFKSNAKVYRHPKKFN